jgi:two-component system phosphate regulon response regulator OmpR
MTKILIICKDLQFSRVLSSTLFYNGFTVEHAATDEIAKKLLTEINFGLVLIDYESKSTNGVSFYQLLNDFNNRPAVIMMGDCYEEVGMIQGMYKSMDDYILKPFGMSELKMIINRQLERKRLTTRPIILGELKIDVARSMVTVKNRIISLGKKELEILILLSRKAGNMVTRDRLITEQRITMLKRKLKAAAGEALQIKTINGNCYKLIALNTCD